MPSDKKVGRYKLGEPCLSLIADFSAANYNAPEVEIIREAIQEHIERRLKEPEMKRRFDAARHARQKTKVTKLSVVSEDDESGKTD